MRSVSVSRWLLSPVRHWGCMAASRPFDLQNPTPAQQTLPNQQGTYFLPIAEPADGKLHICST